MNALARRPVAHAAVAAIDWTASPPSWTPGLRHPPGLLTPQDCALLAGRYSDDALFRSRVVMARHGFGQGEYKYFAYPLPEPVAGLRAALYPPLAAIANRWNEAMGLGSRYPESHARLSRAHAMRPGQTPADAAAAALWRRRL